MKYSLSYSVAIRTLGLHPDKLYKTLKSIYNQRILPEKVNIYIAEGYAIPEKRVKNEQYFYVKKGMIAQRALRYDDIESQWLLLLDDDIALEDTFLPEMAEIVSNLNVDLISPDVYKLHRESTFRKLFFTLTLCFPRRNDEWAFRTTSWGGFTYNANPDSHIKRTESCAGACILIKKDVMRAIRFEDERWLDFTGYAMGEDELFSYKLHKNGYHLYINYNSQVLHLDAKSGHRDKNFKYNVDVAMANVLKWHRMHIYGVRSLFSYCTCIFIITLVWRFIICLAAGIYRWKFYKPIAFVVGTIKGFARLYKGWHKQLPSYIING